jgi:hypothetical protein
MIPRNEHDDGPIVLFDANGNPIHFPPTTQEETTPLNDPQPTTENRRLSQHINIRKFWRSILQFFSRKIWRLTLAFGLPGSLLAVYIARPTFSVESIDSPPGSKFYASTRFILGGNLPITDIAVFCSTNKVVDAWSYTLVLNHFLEDKEYSQTELDSGDSFTVRCPVGWSLVIDKHTQAAAWIWGDPVPGIYSGAIPFQLSNGFPVDGSITGFKSIHFDNISGLDIYNETDLDGTITIRYKWKYLPLKLTKAIRIIGHLDSGNGMKWKPVPNNDPPISDRDPGSGFDTTINGPPTGYAVTTANMNPHP